MNMPIGTMTMVEGFGGGNGSQGGKAKGTTSLQRKKTAKKNMRIQQLLETMTPMTPIRAGGAGAMGNSSVSTAVRQPGYESYSFLAGSSPAPALARQQVRGQTTSQRNLSAVGSGNPMLAAMDEDDEVGSGNSRGTLGNFSLPPSPQSSGIERIQMREEMTGSSPQQYRSMDEDDEDDEYDGTSQAAQAAQSAHMKQQYGQTTSTIEDYTNLEASHGYYSPVNSGSAIQAPSISSVPSVPSYIDGSRPIYNQSLPYSTVSQMGAQLPMPRDELLEKLNKVVHLLEEQKHEKTGHVTEELILYCFLGVFVIFIIDSFVRVGKYVRT